MIDSVEDLQKTQGSKYVQSQIRNSYRQAKTCLDFGRKVLFSGTPCQIDGLYIFLKKEYPLLYTIDIICHGVPNVRMFNDYLNMESNRLHGRITDFIFRDKVNGWGLNAGIVYNCKDGKQSKNVVESKNSSFYSLFLSAKIYRENCYSCKYAKSERVGDVTLGDYWGIEKEHTDYLKENGGCIDISHGCSCVLVNSEKGKELLGEYGSQLVLLPSTLEQVSRHNHQLREPCALPKDRNRILNMYLKHGYRKVNLYYYFVRYRDEALWKCMKLIPKPVKRWVKRILARNKNR